MWVDEFVMRPRQECIVEDLDDPQSELPPPLQTETGTYPNEYEATLVADFRARFGRAPSTAECRAFAVTDDDEGRFAFNRQ